eukprot:354028-Chlamydomonas_euryale.AAC.17
MLFQRCRTPTLPAPGWVRSRALLTGLHALALCLRLAPQLAIPSGPPPAKAPDRLRLLKDLRMATVTRPHPPPSTRGNTQTRPRITFALRAAAHGPRGGCNCGSERDGGDQTDQDDYFTHAVRRRPHPRCDATRRDVTSCGTGEAGRPERGAL